MTLRSPGWLLTVSLTLAPALVLGACAGDGADGSRGSTDDPAARGATAGGGRTHGTLTLGERTLAFRIMRSCDLTDAEIEGPDEMLRGTGTMDDGTRFSVVADRSAVGMGRIHTVSLTYGDLMGGTGYRAEASRTGSGSSWVDEAGETHETPLIRVEGRTVRAEGRFRVQDAGAESIVPGRLEVTCPP